MLGAHTCTWCNMFAHSGPACQSQQRPLQQQAPASRRRERRMPKTVMMMTMRVMLTKVTSCRPSQCVDLLLIISLMSQLRRCTPRLPEVGNGLPGCTAHGLSRVCSVCRHFQKTSKQGLMQVRCLLAGGESQDSDDRLEVTDPAVIVTTAKSSRKAGKQSTGKPTRKRKNAV